MLKTRVLAEPTLVGRERELEELTRCLYSSMEGKGNTVFVSGEAGSGKTRLVAEFLNRTKQKGVTVLSGWCISEATVPYFPFVEAFDAYFSKSYKEESPENLQPGDATMAKEGPSGIEGVGITAWLSGLGTSGKISQPRRLSPQVWKDQLFAAVGKTLRSIAAKGPIILFIEDIHWADSASLALLHYISRIINSEKIFVLATFRSEELTSDAEGRPHLLAETIRQMRREDLLKEMVLQNLDQTEVAKTVENMLGGKVQSKFAERLAKESRGNPLFVVESLRMLFESKSITPENGEWRPIVDKVGIPAKIKDVILRRVSSLKRDQRRVLDVASVIGEKFDVDLLGSVLSQDSLAVLETLNDIAQSTSLVRCAEDYFAFDHSKSQETLYGEIPLALRKGYHARVAEKLEASGKADKLPLSDLAYHYAQAGNLEKVTKYALAAGQDALAKFSNAEAVKHFTHILEIAGEHPERVEERINALEGLGDALYASSLFRESMRKFEELGSTAKKDATRLRALRKAMESAFQLGVTSRLIELIGEAEPYAAADRLENARVLFSRGRALTLQSQRGGSEDYKRALQIFEEEYSLWDTAWALIGVSVYSIGGQAPQEGIAKILRSIALFEELGDSRWQMEAYCIAGLLLNILLLEHEALEMFEKVLEIDETLKMGDYLRLVYANAFASGSLMFLGDFEAALSRALEALELSKKTDSLVALPLIFSVLTMQYALLGTIERAEDWFEKMVQLPSLSHPYITYVGNPQLTKAVFYASKSKWKESNAYFKEYFVLPFILRSGHKALYAWALEKQGLFDEAKVQLEDCQRVRREAQERFDHVSIQANLMVRRQVVTGEEFEMRLDLVNASRKPGAVVRVQNLIPCEFEATAAPAYCDLNNGDIEITEKAINPFQVKTIKLSFKTLKTGIYALSPTVTYSNELSEVKTCQPNPIIITVQPSKPSYEALPGRIPTGFVELDALLLGGIPERYAVVLTSPLSDEREEFTKRFLEVGAEAGEITFYITIVPTNIENLAEQYPSNFHLIVCNPQADAVIQNTPNVYKLKGVDNLTEIDITLTKALRASKMQTNNSKRLCVDILSDVLLQHHAVTTRKWLSGLLPVLKSKGFTVLAVVNPDMHPREEVQAILGLFEGEIGICEKETPKGLMRFLRVKKMTGQKYCGEEIPLTGE